MYEVQRTDETLINTQGNRLDLQICPQQAERQMYARGYWIVGDDKHDRHPRSKKHYTGRDRNSEERKTECRTALRTITLVLSVIQRPYSITRQLPRTGRDCLLPGLA